MMGGFETWLDGPKYRLRCMMCYYGAHFVLIGFKPRVKEWVQYDDACVKSLGHWNAVKDKMVKGKVIPVVLFYENIDNTT